MNNLLRIANDRDVRAVRHHDDLAALLHFLNDRDKQPVDSLAVEILFGLVNDDRLVALVYEQIKDQQQRSALARREMT